MFSEIAPTYDRLNRLLSLGVDQHWRKYAIARISRSSPLQVLDLCGGTGDMALWIKQTRPADTVVVVDFSEAMLRKGQERTPVAAVCGDALCLPFGDERFGVTLCAYGVRNWSSLQCGLKEVHRILSEDGEFIILDFLKAGRKIGDKVGRFYIHRILPLLGGILSGHRQAYQYLADSMEGFCSVEELIQLARETGFEVVHQKRFLMGLCWCFVLKKCSGQPID
jgi:demethylmenaquinone methyltransferase/2-methoxy-6-polyprenyl-1,4-benzoquinol methylase